jgi:putative transposase
MYRWRTLTTEQRDEVLLQRAQLKRPFHSVPHVDSGHRHYLITAACFEHAPHIGLNVERMSGFTNRLLQTLHGGTTSIDAWVVLPNHYHALVSTRDVLSLLKALGHLHGAVSHAWNGEENARGRQVWCNAAETVIKSGDHFGAARLYVHHNPVKHGYVAKWTDWAWSSAGDYLAEVGRERAVEELRTLDVSSFGKGWDDAEM